MHFERSAGILLHPTSLPVGEARPRGVPFRRLARRRRSVVVADLAARAARRVRLSVRVAVGVRRLARAPREAVRPRHRRRDRGLRRAPSVLDGSVGALRRRGRDRRPGALRAGVGSTARVRRRPRRAAHRRPADLRLRRRRRRRGLAGAVRARRGRGRAARRAERNRPAVGEPALRLAGAPRDRLPLVARAVPAHVRARRRLPRRPLPRLRLVLVGSREEQDRARGRWRPGPGRELFDAVAKRARRSAAHRRGSRPDHAAGLPAPRRARPAGHGGSPLGLPRFAAQPAPAGEHVRNEVVYTSIHDTDTVVGFFKGQALELGADRARVLVARVARDRPGAGRARARQRGADEPPGTAKGNWQWRLAPGQLTPALARRLRGLAEKNRR